MKQFILEKIFKILNDAGIKTYFDADNNIVLDSNYHYGGYEVVHKWKSIDSFLIFPKNKELKCEILNHSFFYHSSSIFNWIMYFDKIFIHEKEHGLYFLANKANFDHYIFCHKANKILSQICGDSLEEIAIKLDLAGV